MLLIVTGLPAWLGVDGNTKPMSTLVFEISKQHVATSHEQQRRRRREEDGIRATETSFEFIERARRVGSWCAALTTHTPTGTARGRQTGARANATAPTTSSPGARPPANRIGSSRQRWQVCTKRVGCNKEKWADVHMSIYASGLNPFYTLPHRTENACEHSLT